MAVVISEESFPSGTPELAVDQRHEVFAVAESTHLLLVIRPCILAPENIETIERSARASEEQIPELRPGCGSRETISPSRTQRQTLGSRAMLIAFGRPLERCNHLTETKLLAVSYRPVQERIGENASMSELCNHCNQSW